MTRQLRCSEPVSPQRPVLKIGLLEQEGSACFCLIKSVSDQVAEVKVFGDVAAGSDIMLRVGDRDPIKGYVSWSEGNWARIQFSTIVELPIGPVGHGLNQNIRRRAIPRLSAKAPAVLRTGGRAYSAHLSDISTMGAKIQTGRPVNLGATAFLCVPELPPLPVFVRWIEDCEVGLAFAIPLPIEVIARWSSQMHPRAATGFARE